MAGDGVFCKGWPIFQGTFYFAPAFFMIYFRDLYYRRPHTVLNICIFKLDLLFKVSSADLSSPCVSAMHLRGDWCVADVLSAGGELSTTTTWAPHQLASSSHYSQQQLPPRLEQQSSASAKGHLHSHSQRQSNNNLGKSLHLKRPFHFRCAQWIGLQIW